MQTGNKLKAPFKLYTNGYQFGGTTDGIVEEPRLAVLDLY
jgi:hypothetical protein